MRHYEWDRGQHWKVHVSQLASGEDGWETKFQAMIAAQIKPFLDSNGAILPEFDGYAYERVGGTGAGDTRDIKASLRISLTSPPGAFSSRRCWSTARSRGPRTPTPDF